MRVTLDRQGPLYQAVYRQRTSTERANSHAKKQFLLAHPLVRNIRSVRHLNTLTCILINLKALQRAMSINSSLLSVIPLRNYFLPSDEMPGPWRLSVPPRQKSNH